MKNYTLFITLGLKYGGLNERLNKIFFKKRINSFWLQKLLDHDGESAIY